MENSENSLLTRQRWIPFIVPLLVYMICGAFEPSPPKLLPETSSTDPETLENRKLIEQASGGYNFLGIPILYGHYPIIYSAKLTITVAVLAFVWPAYREFPFSISWLAVVTGVIGIFVWVGLCELNLETHFFGLIGLESWNSIGERPAYNPFEQLADRPAWAAVFLAIRFTGLVIVVPIIEEMFYRGFLMRIVVAPDWWNVPIGTATRMAVFMGTCFPALAHPGEILAALAWFGIVTWLVLCTKNIWDCVTTHAVTNLLLGVYVVTSGEWHLW